MKRLHRWLIPSVHNRYHPKILESLSLSIVVIVLAIMPLLYNVTTNGTMQVLGYATDISAAGLDTVTNTQRSNNGIAPLRINNQLTQAATAKATHMFANNYWAHTAPDGTTPWFFVQSSGYAYTTAGENLAKNFLTSTGVVNGWMNSAAHRANILNAAFVDVGYGVVNGILLGQEVTLVVALYGAPTAVAQAAPPTTQSTATPVAAQPAQPAPPTSSTQEQTETKTEAAPIAPVEQETVTVAETLDPSTDISVVAQSTDTPAGAAVLGAPLDVYSSLNWGQRASIFIMSAIGLLYLLKHTVVWRARRRGVRHVWLRSHPFSQATVLGVAVIVVLASGSGVIL